MSLAQPSLDATVDALAATPASSLRKDTVRNVLRQRSAVLGLIIIGILAFVAIFAPLIAPFDPNVSMLEYGLPGQRGDPPCIHLLGCPADQPQHLMGLDSNIRDEFSRVVYGVAGVAGDRLRRRSASPSSSGRSSVPSPGSRRGRRTMS